jgi:hypothetical protein
MSVKILIDMNLSPDWVPVLARHGYSAIAALRQHDGDLASGALVVVEESKSRVRILPL